MQWNNVRFLAGTATCQMLQVFAKGNRLDLEVNPKGHNIVPATNHMVSYHS